MVLYSFFFFNDTATTEIYTLSLHDALPICGLGREAAPGGRGRAGRPGGGAAPRARERLRAAHRGRSEEHTSELQSRQYLVCRLLLEKKKNRMPSSYIVSDTDTTPFSRKSTI